MSTELQLKQNNLICVDDEIKSFELIQRKAKMMASSSLVPKEYRSTIEVKGNYGKVTGYTENPNGVANCIIAMDMANRLGANELMVMQNLIIISGRPSWSSQWIIASINNCGKYTSLRFDLEDLGNKEVEYIETDYIDSKPSYKTKKITIQNFSCVAYAVEKSTNERLESAKVTIEMAVKEGWYTKSGSKWQTMPEVMLRYRAASFFGKIYAPELLMGLQSAEENQDIASDLSEKFPNAIVAKNAETTTPRKFKPKKTEEIVEQVTELDSSNDVEEFTIPDDVLNQANELFETENV